MKIFKILPILLLSIGCSEKNDIADYDSTQVIQTPFYIDATRTHLPYQDLQQLSMDAAVADLDNDGDLDMIIANEHRPNILLINNGLGKFSNESAARIPQVNHDSEDIGIADFDNDGDLDIIIVSEDDQTNELYFNNGYGTFSDEGNRLPVTGTSNSVVVYDINNDGSVDILIGNNGQNNVLINDGYGQFQNETAARFGTYNDITQDLTLADIDNDGDMDVLVANEDHNRILINDGNGFYSDESNTRLSYRNTPEETREVDAADIDGDGDLDLLYGNVQAFVPNAERQNRLLLNDGIGNFTDITSTHLPQDNNRCFGIAFLDIDNDGDADIITGNTNGDNFDGMTRFSIYLNNGSGEFTDESDGFLPSNIAGRGFDIDFADFNGDGRKDLFLSNRGSQDFLLFGSDK